MRFPLASLFFLDFGRDMPIIDLTFSNRDGPGTRKHELVTNHVVLHNGVLQAIYLLTRFPSPSPSSLETFFFRNCNHGLVAFLKGFLERFTVSQRPTGRKRSDKKAKLLRSGDPRNSHCEWSSLNLTTTILWSTNKKFSKIFKRRR